MSALIELVLTWARSERAAAAARGEYRRVAGVIAARLGHLDLHPEEKRSPEQLELDRGLLAERRGAGEELMEAEATASQFLAQVRAAADAALDDPPVNEMLVVREDVFEDGGWLTCSGCHESNEGHPTGPYSKALRCHLGSGCFECGGIGAIWERFEKLKCCPRFTWGDGTHDITCPGLPK